MMANWSPNLWLLMSFGDGLSANEQVGKIVEKCGWKFWSILQITYGNSDGNSDGNVQTFILKKNSNKKMTFWLKNTFGVVQN